MGKVTVTTKLVNKVNTQSEMQREIMEIEETEKENGSEGAVQERTLFCTAPA